MPVLGARACSRSMPEAVANAAYRASQRALLLPLREAEVRHDERSARPQPAVQLLQRAQPLRCRQVVEGQQARGSVVRPGWRSVDVALVQAHPRGQWPERRFREAQHGGSRVNAIERPVWLALGKNLQLHAAAGAQHQHPGVPGRTLGQKNQSHAMQCREPRYEAWRAVGVVGDGRRIRKVRCGPLLALAR